MNFPNYDRLKAELRLIVTTSTELTHNEGIMAAALLILLERTERYSPQNGSSK